MFEIPVAGKNRHALAMGDGANQEIRIRSLDPFAAAHIVKLGGAFEIRAIQGKVGKSSERVS